MFLVRVSLHSGYSEHVVSIAKAFMKLHAKLFALKRKAYSVLSLDHGSALVTFMYLKQNKSTYCFSTASVQIAGLHSKWGCFLGYVERAPLGRLESFGNYFVQVQNTGRALGYVF